MVKTACLVAGCGNSADDEITVNSHGILLAYAACSDHACEFRWGRQLPGDEVAARGLLGIRN
ncbi:MULTISPECIES: hypothetical protein [Subtercola]|uniref:hypothetical protein n=1 Tax=Subtercola TaxID=120212 RepID=UPI0010A9B035|nr:MULTISPECIES: hypothetical protein [Subtercola]MEA9986605.1 hypothetical protein [Subtercola sp. RTI3]